MSTAAGACPTTEGVPSHIRVAGWAVRAAAGLRGIGPYAAIEILLPGGSLIALLLWLYRRYNIADAIVHKWRLCGRSAVCLLATTIGSIQCVAAENPPGRSTSSIVLAPCELPGWADAARCGVLDVPENRNKPSGRRLQIGVAVIPATGKAQGDPLVPLMGRPGEETISAAAYVERNTPICILRTISSGCDASSATER